MLRVSVPTQPPHPKIHRQVTNQVPGALGLGNTEIKGQYQSLKGIRGYQHYPLEPFTMMKMFSICMAISHSGQLVLEMWLLQLRDRILNLL